MKCTPSVSLTNREMAVIIRALAAPLEKWCWLIQPTALESLLWYFDGISTTPSQNKMSNRHALLKTRIVLRSVKYEVKQTWCHSDSSSLGSFEQLHQEKHQEMVTFEINGFTHSVCIKSFSFRYLLWRSPVKDLCPLMGSVSLRSLFLPQVWQEQPERRKLR